MSASGYYRKLELHGAIQEATEIALQALPKSSDESAIDLALITESSLYDGQSQPSIVVPAVLSSECIGEIHVSEDTVYQMKRLHKGETTSHSKLHLERYSEAELER